MVDAVCGAEGFAPVSLHSSLRYRFVCHREADHATEDAQHHWPQGDGDSKGGFMVPKFAPGAVRHSAHVGAGQYYEWTD